MSHPEQVQLSPTQMVVELKKRLNQLYTLVDSKDTVAQERARHVVKGWAKLIAQTYPESEIVPALRVSRIHPTDFRLFAD